MVKVTGDKRFEHSLPTDLETLLYYAGIVMFFLICRYIFRIARSGLTGSRSGLQDTIIPAYYLQRWLIQTSIAIPTEVDPDWQTLVRICIGGGYRVADQWVDL